MKYKSDDIFLCKECEKPLRYEDLPKSRKDKIRSNGYTFCSKECSKEFCRKLSSKTMAETNRKYASDRMKNKNPMHNKQTRNKMSETLKRIGHKPKIQGGNGKGLTKQQEILFELLPVEFIPEYAVPTKIKKGVGYPTCYKIDIANPKLKIGIEIDGNSHCSLERQKQDKKKTDLLESYGWTILRFNNKDIDKDVECCLTKIRSLI